MSAEQKEILAQVLKLKKDNANLRQGIRDLLIAIRDYHPCSNHMQAAKAEAENLIEGGV
jgi:hypothetical protein